MPSYSLFKVPAAAASVSAAASNNDDINGGICSGGHSNAVDVVGHNILAQVADDSTAPTSFLNRRKDNAMGQVQVDGDQGQETQQTDDDNDNGVDIEQHQVQRAAIATDTTMPTAQINSSSVNNTAQLLHEDEGQPTTYIPQHSTPQPKPQQPQLQQQQQQYHSPLLTTKVNGKGLWRSWKRNFQSKLLALMDLIDNSLDAASVHQQQRQLLLDGHVDDDGLDNHSSSVCNGNEVDNVENSSCIIVHIMVYLRCLTTLWLEKGSYEVGSFASFQPCPL